MRKINTQLYKTYLSKQHMLRVKQNQAKYGSVIKKNTNEVSSDEKIATEKWENEGGHIFELNA